MQALAAPQRISFIYSRGRRAGVARHLAGMADEQRLSLVGGAPSNAACATEISDDRTNIIAYDPFLARAEFDATGRLGGNVVFARDLGVRDTLLRDRFGDRTWHRYHRGYPAAGVPSVFTPYNYTNRPRNKIKEMRIIPPPPAKIPHANQPRLHPTRPRFHNRP